MNGKIIGALTFALGLGTVLGVLFVPILAIIGWLVGGAIEKRLGIERQTD